MHLTKNGFSQQSQHSAIVDVDLINEFSATGFQADPQAMATILGEYGFRFRSCPREKHWHVMSPCAIHLTDAACKHVMFSDAVACCARTLLEETVGTYLSDRWHDTLPAAIIRAPACSEAGLKSLGLVFSVEHFVQRGVVRVNLQMLMRLAQDQIQLLVPLAEDAMLTPQHRNKYYSLSAN